MDLSLHSRAGTLALVGTGGFGGAVARHGVTLWLSGAFPWGTLAANVVGSFALAVLLYERHLAGAVSAETRLLVGTGFLSSFTTYSTFAVETVELAPALAITYVFATYALGVFGVVSGRWVARWVS